MTEKEILHTYEQTLFLVDKQLRVGKFTLEDVATITGGVVHLNHPDDFSLIGGHLGHIGERTVGVKFKEAIAMGREFLIKYVHPDCFVRLCNKHKDFLKNGDKHTVSTDFQKILNVNTKAYEWWMTCTKIQKKSQALFAISTPIKNMGGMTRKIERSIEQDMFMRRNSQRFMSLTKREKEVLQLVAQGFTNQGIADKLFISKHTVSDHRKNINKKLNIRYFRGIIQYAQAFDLL